MEIQAARRSSRSGFSMLEMLISVTILVLVMSAATLVSGTGYDAYSSTTARVALQNKALRALDRVAGEIVTCAESELWPDPLGDFGTQDLRYRQVVGATGGVADLGPVNRLFLRYAPGEIDDGLDNDGDGLADDCELAFTRDEGGANETTIVLCRDVREMLEGELESGDDTNGNGVTDERGFNLHRVGDVIEIRLSVEKIGPRGERMSRTLETSTRLRN